MRSPIVVLLAVLAVGLALWRLLPEPDPEGATGGEPGWSGGRLREGLDMSVLELSGTPKERGIAHGAKLKSRIRAWYEETRLREGEMEPLWESFHAPRMKEALPARLREEMEGIAEGAEIPFFHVLFLNVLYDLRGFRDFGFSGACAVRRGGEVVRRVDAADLKDKPRELVVFVHRGERTLVMVGLPGMVGGFLGVRGSRAAALRPVRNGPDPALTGLGWTLLLREVLERGPDGAWPATLDASIPYAADDRVGTLDVSPRGSRWHAAGGDLATAHPEPFSAEGELAEDLLQRRRRLAHRILEEEPAAHQIEVRLKAESRAVRVTIVRDGARFAQSIRYSD